MIDGIYIIKHRSTLHKLVANYTDKHDNKRQGIGHIEPSLDHMPQMSINSLSTQKMIDEHVQPDTFTAPLHTLPIDVTKLLNQLLVTFKLQFAQYKTGISTTYLTKMQIDTGDSEPVLQRPYPISMKHYDWVRNEIIKFLGAQRIDGSHSSWSAPIIVVPEAYGGLITGL